MIEAYPFFLQKDSLPFRFEIVPGLTHEIIQLGAKLQDELDFSLPIKSLELIKQEGKKCIIQIDFGFNEGFDFSNQTRFSSCILAIDEILKQVLRPYKEVIEGVLFFKGTAFLETIFSLDEDSVFDHIDHNLEAVFNKTVNTRLAAATVLGTILHRLISFMDDDIPCFAVFEDADRLTPLERAILFSKARFEHIFLVYSNPEFQSTNIDLSEGLSALGYFSAQKLEQPPKVDIGILLPEDNKLNPEILAQLENFMLKIKEPYRVICEKIFNECWNDIQKVYFCPKAIHPMTLRMIKGFEASGGEALQL